MGGVVIVESPVKARTIAKYLGKGYQVVACFGHLRDLPPRDGSVRPEEGFAMDWESDQEALKRIKAITQAIKESDSLYLTTDPDREGEAISWHIYEILSKKKVLKGVSVWRIVFHEVTESAIKEAFKAPRAIDYKLVEAYLARRALDYLVGFQLSPLLWRKLPGTRSAGRVQSVALRLICDREEERERFQSREYWSIEGEFEAKEGLLNAYLHTFDVELKQFSLTSAAQVDETIERLRALDYRVDSVKTQAVSYSPSPPFTTSTLQQEGSRLLSMKVSGIMRTAQKLYEGLKIDGTLVGLITYMRTDSVHLSESAVTEIRERIKERYGERFVASKPRVYQTKVKNAQEAHEAIRPTQIGRTPESVKPYLTQEQYALYELIWLRTVASQMANARYSRVTVDIAAEKVVWRAVGTYLVFSGYRVVYPEGKGDEAALKFPPLTAGELLTLKSIAPAQHWTRPPPRYAEASMVKRLEELGIGRPSTYASILQILQERKYVRIEQKQFIPENRGRILAVFLKKFFKRYVEYTFTADLEDQLDAVSRGELVWKTLLHNFWNDFFPTIREAYSLSVTQVIEVLNQELDYLFPNHDSDRVCPSCASGQLSLKLGKSGPFIGCSRYPECDYLSDLTGKSFSPAERILGKDPETDQTISVKYGRYGPYVQKESEKPKRIAIPAIHNPETLDLATAIKLLNLPKILGRHPQTEKEITLSIGPYGPYLKYNNHYVSIPAKTDPLALELSQILDLIRQKVLSKESVLGSHPVDQSPITMISKRFQTWIMYNDRKVRLPKDVDRKTVTLEQALELLSTENAESKTPRKRSPAAKKKKVSVKATKKTAEQSLELLSAEDVELKTSRKRSPAAKKKKVSVKATKKTAEQSLELLSAEDAELKTTRKRSPAAKKKSPSKRTTKKLST